MPPKDPRQVKHELCEIYDFHRDNNIPRLEFKRNNFIHRFQNKFLADEPRPAPISPSQCNELVPWRYLPTAKVDHMNMKTNFNIIKNSLQKYDPDSQCVVLVFIYGATFDRFHFIHPPDSQGLASGRNTHGPNPLRHEVVNYHIPDPTPEQLFDTTPINAFYLGDDSGRAGDGGGGHGTATHSGAGSASATALSSHSGAGMVGLGSALGPAVNLNAGMGIALPPMSIPHSMSTMSMPPPSQSMPTMSMPPMMPPAANSLTGNVSIMK